MSEIKHHQRIFVALDTTEVDHAVALTDQLKGTIGGIKIGKEFFTANGPQGARQISAMGLPLFLDLKFHDIPNTVASAVRAALPLKPTMLTVHAIGGATMMKAAAEAAAQAGSERPLILAVTVLTSSDESDINQTGIQGTVMDQVRRLAALAKDCGLDGVVCSGSEAEILRQDLGADFKLVTPGIRPDWSQSKDQKRTMTPREAISVGADYLVIGRPITQATTPREAAQKIIEDITRGDIATPCP